MGGAVGLLVPTPEQLNTTTREAVHVNGGGPETFFFSFTLNVFSVISVLKALIKL